MKILIASVYNQNSLKWYDIQSTYIKKTTSLEFEHVVFYFGEKNIQENFIKLNCNKQSQEQHLYGLNEILNFFYKKEEYDYCLILDSDAFPIQKKWDENLIYKIKEVNYHISCPIRFENLDVFYHPCIAFFDRNAIGDISFNFSNVSNLLDYKFNEVFVNSKNKRIFPLLKTNVFNPHPVLCSIYYGMFYHHGCGSRNFYCRSIHVNNYYEENKFFYKNSINSIFNNPAMFLSKLSGIRIL